MFSEVLIGSSVAVGAGALAWVMRERRLRAAAVQRLAEPTVQVLAAEERPELAPALPRFPWLPPLLAVMISMGLWLGLAAPPVFCVAVGLVVLVLAHLIEVNVHEGRGLKLENQLADAIDMVVGALGAGAGTMDAIESAARESSQPLRQELLDMVGRIRYGDRPKVVLEELAERVPLETFELFSFTLSVHEDTGGSLTSTLSTVGRTIRDRIELRRRVRAQATQAQGSVIGILLITYAIALVTWRTGPERMEEFIGSEIGISLVSGAIVLQAIGLWWMFRLTRIKY